MAKYKNNKAGVLGLNFSGESGARTVNPGEVFEANKEDIPEHYFTQGWIAEAKDGEVSGQNPDVANPNADQRIDPKFEGPNPTQGSGTSAFKSETDKAAKDSGAYDNPRDPSGATQPHDDKQQQKRK